MRPPQRVSIDPRTGTVQAHRQAGEPVEVLARRRHQEVALTPAGTEAVVYDRREYHLVLDPGHDWSHTDRPAGAVPVMAGWLVPTR